MEKKHKVFDQTNKSDDYGYHFLAFFGALAFLAAGFLAAFFGAAFLAGLAAFLAGLAAFFGAAFFAGLAAII